MSSKPLDAQDVALAGRLLRVTSSIFAEHALIAWLDQGTLLGAVRDDALLPWESDIDLSMWAADEPAVIALRDAFERQGVSLSVHSDRRSIYLTGAGPIYVDISFHDNVGGHVEKTFVRSQTSRGRVGVLAKRFIRSAPRPIRVRLDRLGRSSIKLERRTVRIESHWFEHLRPIEFLGVSGLNAPADTERYLEYKYGSEWRVPIQDWDFFTQDGAIKRDQSYSERMTE